VVALLHSIEVLDNPMELTHLTRTYFVSPAICMVSLLESHCSLLVQTPGESPWEQLTVAADDGLTNQVDEMPDRNLEKCMDRLGSHGSVDGVSNAQLV
jgi:hypothetical protein